MNRKKTLCLIFIVAAAVAIPVTCFCLIRGKNGERPAETAPTTDTGETVIAPDVTGAVEDDTIPAIDSHDSETGSETDRLDLDVSEVTRNPDAEVVDSTIEYGTKEVPTDAE